MSNKSGKYSRGELRIIGGQWRGKKLSFPALPGVRPTSSRIRETLFNWLMFKLAGKRCLDLFAGSGALGMEALSRGAAEVIFVEQQKLVFNQLAKNLVQLKGANYRLIHNDAFEALGHLSKIDIVFLDPPFTKGLLQRTLNALVDSACLTDAALIYCEYEQHIMLEPKHSKLELLKAKHSGQVHYQLFQYHQSTAQNTSPPGDS